MKFVVEDKETFFHISLSCVRVCVLVCECVCVCVCVCVAADSSILAGESHGQRSLVGYSPEGCKEFDMIEIT